MSKTITFCMRCGSTNIKPIVYGEFGLDNRVQCIDCDTIGFPISGDEKFYKNFLEEKKNGKK